MPLLYRLSGRIQLTVGAVISLAMSYWKEISIRKIRIKMKLYIITNPVLNERNPILCDDDSKLTYEYGGIYCGFFLKCIRGEWFYS